MIEIVYTCWYVIAVVLMIGTFIYDYVMWRKNPDLFIHPKKLYWMYIGFGFLWPLNVPYWIWTVIKARK